MDLALFDFDGTITTRGTYPGFMRMAVARRRKIVGGSVLSPVILAYRGGLVSETATRKVISRVGFWNDDPGRVRRLGEQYARDVLPALVRPVARDRMAWHQARGDHVVVVSASLDCYLEPWCRAVGVDVICTRLEERGGRLTGRYLGGDCCGETKARRIRDRFPRGGYGLIFAYGDTEDDRQMLELADRKFFRWQEVQQVPAPSAVTRQCDGGV